MTITQADIARIDWRKSDGLVPAIVQHAGNGSVLMLGYMNAAALEATLARGRVVFFSRSRQRLWEKGETSGHFLELVDVRLDCDADTLLVSAHPHGPVCHTGTRTCFGDDAGSDAGRIAFLVELDELIAQRIAESPEGSYTARLYASGTRRIAQKVGEEGLEVALAAVAEPDPQLISEGADLLFHLLVLLKSRDLRLQQLVDELRQRHAARAGLAKAPSS
ncbi:MAG TPA: bifunctional phosphoribosyl-AMP cyclohydrolase/phosphoribosyl-ATP diphosphatase HisIE [Steroidobacteraceae bacterium]|nr:bifunctional phosphoribosyl-AMP cyclohydrolase/phosphoribosyl-ATP diphosphatase HisIE [Steroidobacteraceae bacterium]